jgi:hypothetical protein
VDHALAMASWPPRTAWYLSIPNLKAACDIWCLFLNKMKTAVACQQVSTPDSSQTCRPSFRLLRHVPAIARCAAEQTIDVFAASAGWLARLLCGQSHTVFRMLSSCSPAGRDENGRKRYLFGNQFLVVFL